jgi:hypothetical protein
MASGSTVNVLATITTSNTFDHWRVRDNLVAEDVNEIVRGNFIKPKGNVTITEGKLTLANSSGGFILDVRDDTNIDGTLTVREIEVDNSTGHVYDDSGDFWIRRMTESARLWVNSNTSIWASNVLIQNAESGTLNVLNQITTVNSSLVNIANTDLLASLEVHPANSWFYGANVTFQNVSDGSINVFNRLLNVNSGNSFFGNTDALATFNVHPANVNFFGTNVTISNTTHGSLNVDNRLLMVTTPNIFFSNTDSTARFNVNPNTYFHSGHVNVANVELTSSFEVHPITNFFGTNVNIANTTQGGTFNVTSNTFITASNVTISNTQVGGTLNVASNTEISAQKVLISNVTGDARFNVYPNTYFFGGHVNVANTSQGATFNVTPNTWLLSNANQFGTLNVTNNVAVYNLAVSNNATVAWNVTAGNVYVVGNVNTGNSHSRGNVTAVDTISVSNTTSGNGVIAASSNVYGNNIVAKANVSGVNAVMTQNVTAGNALVSNVIATSIVTVSNVTSGNGIIAAGSNVYANNVVVKNNVLAANVESTNNLRTSYLSVSSLANVACANVTTLFVQDLTVANPIAAPAETTGSSYRLRVDQGSREDGFFGLNLGSTANGNAWIRFDTSSGNVWRVTANSTEGTYYTIITRQNLSDSVTSTDSSNVASLTAVKIANANALAAYEAANSSGNTVTVLANDQLILAKANINFNNSASINVSAAPHFLGFRTNVAFTVNTASITSVGRPASLLTLDSNVVVSQSINTSGNITGTLKSTQDHLFTASVSGSVLVNCNTANWFRYTVTGTPTFTFQNVSPVGRAMTITLIVQQNATGGYTPAWGNTIYWAGGQVPPASTGANKIDMWTFTTYDGGSTFIGTLAVKDAR